MQQRGDLTRVDPRHQNHCGEHEDSIENIQECLVRDEISVVALRILDEAKEASDENEQTGSVKRVELSLPRDRIRVGFRGRLAQHADVKHDAGDDEEAEKEELDYKTANDDLFSQVYGGDCSACHDTTSYMKLLVTEANVFFCSRTRYG